MHCNKIKCIKKKDLQIQCMKNQCDDLIRENNINNLRYKQLLKEIDNMYLLLENNISKCCDTNNDNCIESSNGTCSNTLIFKYKLEIQTFVVDKCATFLYITAVGGGGAGGIGSIKDMYYYSGGGGGAGACIIKKPIKVIPGTVISIEVGKGGTASINEGKGGNTTIRVLYPNGSVKLMILLGGKGGRPCFSELSTPGILSVAGGEGGISDCGLAFLSGANGNPGFTTIPSQIAACGGSGGSSVMSHGGKGGGNYFSSGGNGGRNVVGTLTGEVGEFGSGGGGSVPRFTHGDILSGNGGDGMVIIEW